MQVLIEKDSANLVPKECTEAEAQAFVDMGFAVHVVAEDGSRSPFVPTEPAAEAPAEEAPTKKRKG